MENLKLDDIKHMFDLTPEEQIEYLKSKDIEISDNWEKTAELIHKHAFTVTKVFQADMLLAFKELLEKAIETGETEAEFKKNFREQFENKGFLGTEERTPWRLGLVYRMNVQNAYSEGRWTQMQSTADDLPYLLSLGANEAQDRRITPVCKRWHRKVVRKNDMNYKKNHRVPRHFLCRSRETSLSETRLAELGLSVTDSRTMLQFKNAPGFIRTNETWQPDLDKFPDELRTQLEKELQEVE